MSCLSLGNICSLAGKAANFSCRVVFEVLGVAAIPYWSHQWTQISEERSRDLATIVLGVAAVRLVANISQRHLYEIIQAKSNPLSSSVATLLYSLGTGKSPRSTKALRQISVV